MEGGQNESAQRRKAFIQEEARAEGSAAESNCPQESAHSHGGAFHAQLSQQSTGDKVFLYCLQNYYWQNTVPNFQQIESSLRRSSIYLKLWIRTAMVICPKRNSSKESGKSMHNSMFSFLCQFIIQLHLNFTGRIVSLARCWAWRR
jgi:hypothetical protein